MTIRGYTKWTMAILMSLMAVESPRVDAQTAPRKKMFIDQDIGGATGTDNQSLMMLLQAPGLDVVGISIVAGDGQVKASTAWTLRMLELTGYGHVPVAQGAKFPLINSREETALWEATYGVFGYKGAWNPARYHSPDEVPVLPPGSPTIKATPQHAVNFMIETIRKYPGEVILWCGGPL
ncbi:MAG: nucleoside hydrolase, partial [Acidobacteria bacterium]|nr:nucleoside hydrolase [Acidobacteriota bacterium]